MVNPYVIIATHNRLSITKKNIECILPHARVIVVVSDQSEGMVFKNLFGDDVFVVHHNNFPLGSKWQAGVNAAKMLKADPLIINGSDDILSPEYFKKVEAFIANGYDFIGLKNWYVYDKKEMFHFHYTPAQPLGGGRAYTAKLLNKLNWVLFDIDRNKLLDDLGYNKVRMQRIKSILLYDPLILSVKGDWPVMNPIDKMLGHANCQEKALTKSIEQILTEFKYEL